MPNEVYYFLRKPVDMRSSASVFGFLRHSFKYSAFFACLPVRHGAVLFAACFGN
jgi:hypothetical protein